MKSSCNAANKVSKNILILLCLQALALQTPLLAVPPPPMRIGGTVTADGTQLAGIEGKTLEIRVKGPSGTAYYDAAGLKAEDTNGLNQSGLYMIDIPMFETADQPGGANEGDQAEISVIYGGIQLDISSPAGGALSIGAGGEVRTVNITASSPASSGSLRVEITPADAIQAGAMWRADAGEWLRSGQVASGLSAGTHTVEFKDIALLTTPASQSVNVVANQIASATGAYTNNSSYFVTVGVSPLFSGRTVPAAGTAKLVASGATLPISAEPEGGYVFIRWGASPESAASFTDAFKASTGAKITGAAAVTAYFSLTETIYLAPGSAMKVEASRLGLEEFAKMPKVAAGYKEPVKGKAVKATFKNYGKAPIGAFIAEWTKAAAIYDKAEYKGVQLGPALEGDPIKSRKLDSVNAEGKAFKDGKQSLNMNAYLVAPQIESAVLTENILRIEGMYFGSKLPKILVEVEKDGKYKYLACKIDKGESLKFQNAQGKELASCMKVLETDTEDGEIGFSRIVAAYPAIPKGAAATGYLILDNKAAMAAKQIQEGAAEGSGSSSASTAMQPASKKPILKSAVPPSCASGTQGLVRNARLVSNRIFIAGQGEPRTKLYEVLEIALALPKGFNPASKEGSDIRLKLGTGYEIGLNFADASKLEFDVPGMPEKGGSAKFAAPGTSAEFKWNGKGRASLRICLDKESPGEDVNLQGFLGENDFYDNLEVPARISVGNTCEMFGLACRGAEQAPATEGARTVRRIFTGEQFDGKQLQP